MNTPPPVTPPQKNSPHRVGDPKSKSGGEPTVLVADDDVGLLRLIEKSLRREGMAIATASSGRAALEWLTHRRPDLLLLDLKLQDLEGQEIIRRLEESGQCPPFIVITGQSDERVAVEMMKRGALDYLVKDVEFLHLMPAVVRRALEQLEDKRRLAELEKEILEISDRERQRIGQDLHDGICQTLAGIELMSQVLEQKLATRSKADAASAAEIGRHVREAISQTRAMARGLSPMTLQSEGLISALGELAARAESMFHVTCRFESQPTFLVRDPTVATHLYRIAQEAVSNAIKHGKATRIEVQLAPTPRGALLRVRDNGSGFAQQPPGQTGTGMGLRIMRYRAGIIGGSLHLESPPGGGVSVECSLPLSSA